MVDFPEIINFFLSELSLFLKNDFPLNYSCIIMSEKYFITGLKL